MLIRLGFIKKRVNIRLGFVRIMAIIRLGFVKLLYNPFLLSYIIYTFVGDFNIKRRIYVHRKSYRQTSFGVEKQ